MLVCLLLTSASFVSAADLPGFGTRDQNVFTQGGSVFKLKHSGVIAGSVTVRAEGRPLRAGRDFTLNPAAGMVSLLQPLAAGSMLTVQYRYDPVQDRPGATLLLNPTLPIAGLQFRSLVLSSLEGAPRAAGGAGGSEVVGFEATKTFGSGLKLTGTYYSGGGLQYLLKRFQPASDPRTSLVTQLFGVQEKKEDLGHLQDLQVEKLKLLGGETSFRYTDVGSKLDFGVLKAQQLTEDQQKQLALYEKSKGLKSWQLASTLQPKGIGSLGFNMLNIADGKSSATQQSLKFESKRLRFGGDFLSIDAGMGARFKDTPLAALGDPKNLLGRKKQTWFLEAQPLDGLSFAANQRKEQFLDKPDGTFHTDYRLAYASPSLKNAEKPSGLGISFFRNDDLTRAGSGPDKRKVTDRIDFSYKAANGAGLTAFQETTRNREGDNASTTGVTKLEYASSPKAPTTFTVGMENQRQGQGNTLSTQRFALASHLPKEMFLSALFERGVAKSGDTSRGFGTTKLDFATNPKAATTLALGFEDVSQPNGNGRSVTRLNLASQVRKGIMVAALYEGGSAREGESSFGVGKRGLKIETDNKKKSFLTYDSLSENDGLGRGKLTRKYQMAWVPSKWFSMQASEDSVITRTPDKVNRTYKRALHAETDQKKPFTFLLDRKDEMKDNVRNLLQTRTIAGRFGKGLGLTSTAFLRDQGPKGWEQTDTLALEWTQIKGFRLTGNLVSGSSDKLTSFDKAEVKLEGEPNKNLKWDASIATMENSDGLDRRDITGNVTAAVSKDTKLTASVVDMENQGEALQKTQTIKVERPVASAVVGFELGTARFASKSGFLTNGITFGTPEKSKATVRFNSHYRNYAGPAGDEMLAFSHSLTWKPGDVFSLSLSGFRRPDVVDDKGKKVVPMSGESLDLAAQLSKQIKLSLGFAHEKVIGALDNTIAWRFGVQGTLGMVENLEIQLASRIASQWKRELPTQYLKLVYKRELNAENSLAFTTEAKVWRDSDPKTNDEQEVVGRIDWVRAF